MLYSELLKLWARTRHSGQIAPSGCLGVNHTITGGGRGMFLRDNFWAFDFLLIFFSRGGCWTSEGVHSWHRLSALFHKQRALRGPNCFQISIQNWTYFLRTIWDDLLHFDSVSVLVTLLCAFQVSSWKTGCLVGNVEFLVYLSSPGPENFISEIFLIVLNLGPVEGSVCLINREPRCDF